MSAASAWPTGAACEFLYDDKWYHAISRGVESDALILDEIRSKGVSTPMPLDEVDSSVVAKGTHLIWTAADERKLAASAKPPPEREFEDIFQKFKLSFNLLAKLKAHIHDPNAPELVHFLFTPLALIVDASHDSQYGPNLPTKVLAPLLTKSAVDLLINCLTSKESELWHSLGEPWYVPREQWKGYVPPYKVTHYSAPSATISRVRSILFQIECKCIICHLIIPLEYQYLTSKFLREKLLPDCLTNYCIFRPLCSH